MTTLAIVLILLSAVLHAGWNLLSKHSHPSTAFFFWATLFGVLACSPYLLWELTLSRGVLQSVGALLLMTGFSMALYYAALAGAYRHGAISIAYPLARAIPVLLVSLYTVVFDHGQPLSGGFALGVALILLGCFMLPMRHLRDFRLRNYWNPSCGFALLAALGTTGYTLLDDVALQQLRAQDLTSAGNLRLSLVYGGLEALACCLWLGLLIVLIPREADKLRLEWRGNRLQALVTGLVIWVAYLLVLISLAHVDNVGYVIAFRQLSIPLGAALGMLVLREAVTAPKLLGMALLFLGLSLVALA